MAGEMLKALDRLADAVEKLSVEPTESEINNLPPVCPSCNAFDPQITLGYQEGGTGRMSEIVVNGTCQCGEAVFIVIDSYSTHNSLEMVEAEIKAREKAGYFKQ